MDECGGQGFVLKIQFNLNYLVLSATDPTTVKYGANAPNIPDRLHICFSSSFPNSMRSAKMQQLIAALSFHEALKKTLIKQKRQLGLNLIWCFK